jgi:hypothetical protein
MSVIDWPRLHAELVPIPRKRAAFREVVAIPSIAALPRKRCKVRACFHCGYLGGNTLVPVDGLPGKYECPNVVACEQRIVSGRCV